MELPALLELLYSATDRSRTVYAERAAAASAALTEFERRGGRAAERTKLEAEFAA